MWAPLTVRESEIGTQLGSDGWLVELQLISTIQKIARRIAGKGQVNVILPDFTKAFDKVPHRRLL